MKKQKTRRHRASYWLYELIFVGPVILFFLISKGIPSVTGFWYSLTDWNGISSTYSFVGPLNFQNLLEDSQFWQSLWFTVRFAFAVVAVTNIIGFVLAYILTQKLYLSNFFRAGFYLPNIIGGLVLGYIWQFIFTRVFAYIGSLTGLSFFNQLWLGTPETSFWALVIVESWRTAGYMMLIYIAGFGSLPKDCLESAKIDGAREIDSLFRVKIPLMMQSFTRCIFLSILNAFRVYDLNFSLTQGGPYLSSESVSLNIYTTAFTNNKAGYGAAKSLIFLVIVVLISQLQVYFTSKEEVEL